MNFGFEAEYLLEEGWSSSQVLALGIPGVSKEFFCFMLEVITGQHQSAHSAMAELRSQVEQVQAAQVPLHDFASWGYEEPWQEVTYERVTADNPYYRWVYYEATQNPLELHHVGVHLNLSAEGLQGDKLIVAVNRLRALAFVFILLTANSPLRGGTPAGCLSRRSYFYPNRYDVPFWRSADEFREWIRLEEAVGRIFPGKARCWMTVSPRLVGDSLVADFERIEVRCLDSGLLLPWDVLGGCCELCKRMVAGDGGPVPAFHSADVQYNDKAAALYGRQAKVRMGDKLVSAREVAAPWCQGIPALERVLEEGSPAEQYLQRLRAKEVA